MSQFFQGVTAGALPPVVPTSFETNSGLLATPAGNQLDVFGGQSTANNTNGIATDAPGSSDILSINLTNRVTGTATTTDAVTPVTVYSFPLGITPGVYQFTINIVGFDLTTPQGSGYTSFRTVRTSGAAATGINATIASEGEEGTMTVGEVVNSLVGNNLVLTVTGLAGKTIHWYALTTYIFVS